MSAKKNKNKSENAIRITMADKRMNVSNKKKTV